MKQRERTNLWKLAGIYGGVAWLTAMGCCGVLAVLVSGEILNLETAKLLAAILSGSVLTGACWLGGCRAGKGRLPAACAVAGAEMALLLLGKATLFSAASFGWDWRLSVPVVAAAAGAMLASRRKVYRK